MAQTELNSLARGIGEFTRCLYRTKQNHINRTNDVFSPVNIHAFLVLLSHDPWFQTRDFLNRVLQLDVSVAAAHYKDIFAAFSIPTDLRISNIAFLRHHGVIEDTFKNRLKHDFSSKISFLDFVEIEGANEAINAWVGNETDQKIKHFSDVKNGTSMNALSTTHFKSKWADPFAEEDTVTAEFFSIGDAKIDVQMMRMKGEFYYKKDNVIGAKILKLPFAESDISLVIILPDNSVNIDRVYHDLSQLTTNMVKQEVDVSLPKFKMNEALLLADPLKRMGLNDVFSAKFVNIVEGEILNLNEIQQKVYLDLNEGGLEAATGTSAILTKVIDEMTPSSGLIIYEASITTEISNRFAKTNVIWRVNNSNTTASDAKFRVILTETAFITGFVMEIDGHIYKSYIKEKLEAKGIYNRAVARGQSAGLVEAKTRDSREFTVSVNLEPDSVAVFSLTYEEMLQRVHDQYELVLNICPGQIVDDLNIEVRINESQPLKFVKTPPLRTGTDTRTDLDKYLDPQSKIRMINSKTASVKFHPDAETQRKMTHYLRTKTSEGLSGQFVVQYDVERDPSNGEVLLQDGYFVHFFAPNDLDSLPKHVVFVLDTSGSMTGRKLEQLKDAMVNILSDLRNEDMFSIVEFNSNVIVWDVNLKRYTMLTSGVIRDFREPFPSLERIILADPQRVSDNTIKKAKDVVQGMVAEGNTFIIGGLETALYLVKMGQEMNEEKNEEKHPIIIFLTDGEPNVGIRSTDEITDTVTQLNTKDKVPIFSLSFGDQADKHFLRELSQKNFGFSRYIYEAADASLQLQDFYKRISSPLLRNIKFKYDAEVEQVTKTWFPIYFRGSELVVSGRYGGSTFPTVINCWGPHGLICVNSTTERPVTSLERMWAYLTVKQLLDERDTALNPVEVNKKAVDLALKYSFVTDVTSLVVVKPNETATTPVDQPIAAKPRFGGFRDYAVPSSLRASNQFSFGSSQGGKAFGSASTAFSQSRGGQAFGMGSVAFPQGGDEQVFGTESIAFPQGGGGQIFGTGSTCFPHGGGQSFGSIGVSQGGVGQAFGTGSIAVSQSGGGQTFGTGSTCFPQGGGGQAFGTGSISVPQGGGGQTFGTGSTCFPQVGGGQTFGTGPIAVRQPPGVPGVFGSSTLHDGLFGIPPSSQPDFGSFQVPAGIFGTTTSDTAPSKTSSPPSFTFGYPQGTSTVSGTQGNSTGEAGSFLNQGPPTALKKPEAKKAADVKKKTEEFTANRPFYIMLQLEKDGVVLLLLHGYIQRPSY